MDQPPLSYQTLTTYLEESIRANIPPNVWVCIGVIGSVDVLGNKVSRDGGKMLVAHLQAKFGADAVHVDDDFIFFRYGGRYNVYKTLPL